MDFSGYENSTAVVDQSANQQFGFFTVQCDVDVLKFIEEKDITLCATSESAEELSHQAYGLNLFSGHYSVTADNLNDEQNYVLSNTNCSLTFTEIDDGGHRLRVLPATKNESNIQPLLWDSSDPFKRMARDKRSNTDISNILLARSLAAAGTKFFVFLNDNDQINQLKIEGYRCVRPADLLAWMVEDNYITKQKATWCYERAKKHNPRWTEKGKKFSSILNN